MSESGDRWREWFDRLGEVADVNVVNATANLVIAECDIHTAPLQTEIRRLSKSEDELRGILRAILAEPYGCSLCDSGKPRNETKGHQPDCPYGAAREAIANAETNS